MYSTNSDEFFLEIDKWKKDLTQKQAIRFTKKMALELLRRIILKSPVRTGRFRANWMVGIGERNQDIADNPKDSRSPIRRQALKEAIAALSSYKTLTTIHLSNNLPYARALENGHSKKAPQGMVAISIAEMDIAMGELSAKGDTDVV